MSSIIDPAVNMFKSCAWPGNQKYHEQNCVEEKLVQRERGQVCMGFTIDDAKITSSFSAMGHSGISNSKITSVVGYVGGSDLLVKFSLSFLKKCLSYCRLFS